MMEAIAMLGHGPLTEDSLRETIWPLFSRVMRRPGIYLANHSLGRPLDQVAGDVSAGLDQWYERLDDAWEEDGWPGAIQDFRSEVAGLIGAGSYDSIVPKTSAGQGLRAVLNALPQPVNVVSTRGEFDSIDFILKTYAAKNCANITWVEGRGDIPLFSAEDIVTAIGPETDLVVVSQVFFSTGQVLTGLDQVISAAHGAGAAVLVDTYHAVGVLPVDMMSLNADFMIGGSYKYTRGGPGACWLAIHPQHLATPMRTLDTGWFAKESPFSYARPEEPRLGSGGNAWMESTPPVMTAYQAISGLRFTRALGIERLRDYNLRQQEILRAALSENGVTCYEPSDPTGFGAFTLVPHADASGISKQLAKAGVITDARGGCIRFGPDLLNSEAELREAARITGTIVKT